MSVPREQSHSVPPPGRKSALKVAATNAVVVLVSLLVTGLFIELGSWIWVKYFRAPYLTKWEFAVTQPPPYQGAD